MILVTRLNGSPFALNPDLLERVDVTPDTVVTLIDGKKYVVAESVHELVELVRSYRASVVSAAGALAASVPGPRAVPSPDPQDVPLAPAVPLRPRRP